VVLGGGQFLMSEVPLFAERPGQIMKFTAHNDFTNHKVDYDPFIKIRFPPHNQLQGLVWQNVGHVAFEFRTHEPLEVHRVAVLKQLCIPFHWI